MNDNTNIYNFGLLIVKSLLFYAIKFLNDLIGYAICQDNTYKFQIVKTIDGGNTWFFYSLSSLNFSNPYSTIFDFDISIIDENNAFILCRNNLIKTINGGLSWELVKETTTTSFKSISFLDANIGYLIESYAINKTVDGGLNWTTCNSSKSVLQNDMYFVNQNIGYSVLENGTISKTLDGGTTWDFSTIATVNLYHIQMFDENNGFICGDHVLYKSGNGVSILETKVNDNILVFPNPANNILYLNGLQNANIKIFDLNGKLLINKQNTDNQIDVSNLQNGIYTIKIDNGISQKVSKFVKQ